MASEKKQGGPPLRPDLSVVVPCYNEAENLPLLVRGYADSAPRGLAWELVLVDNGSRDSSQKVLKKLLSGPHGQFARQVRVPVNMGYGHGILQGLRAAKGRVLAYSHADMQCAPADVFKAYDLLLAQPDPAACLVKGRRLKRQAGPRAVSLVMALLSTLVLARPLSDINAQPKVFPRALLSSLVLDGLGFEFDLYLLYQAARRGYKTATLPVIFAGRAFGVSKWAASLASRWRTMLRVFLFIFKLRLLPGLRRMR